ncbi:hypothetical protein CXG81DRAFT_13112 [Caulochytrium protostelioides]|uniref:Small nuclear ribonucleoprotein G n=1 Tax=Caulochytrium protostelioides TaxID=1555241 RepID=A0A4P9X5U7_9FUNG|nr:like-Sm ribonucleo protein [Caulochytrium protostelioides]RKP00523.1 hypothetical protein CXG81DRAFT_13112 [Caulochytrium protostelioides]|eukprot:RKP00523.1 hypothetical protein CXG81DRAFT_13112 [Caulochytrium protostelioides]
MPKDAPGPDLKKYMDKRVLLTLNAGRRVSGVLRGFDPFMNLVLDETMNETDGATGEEIGTAVIRGNAVSVVEVLGRA